MQEEQSEAFRDARRSRTAARLTRDLSRLVDADLVPGEIGDAALEVIVDGVLCDGGALLREREPGSGVFSITHAVGIATPSPARIVLSNVPAYFYASTGNAVSGPAAALLDRIGLPFALWAYDRRSGWALVVGNRAEVNVNRAFGPDDRELVEGALLVFLDVRARRVAEIELRAAKEAAERAHRQAEEARVAAERAAVAKSYFLATMSHEIRTPLTTVLGTAELLAHEPFDPQQRRRIEAILAAGRHLLAVIDDVLDYSRLEAGRVQLQQVELRPVEVASAVYALVEQRARDAGLALRFEVEPTAETVLIGDPTRLRQVLLNLVSNAVKYTPRGAVTVRLRVDVGRSRATLRGEVEDTGIGIPEDKRQELFEPFRQAGPSAREGERGSGLGLAISKRLVSAMGGSIGVVSEAGRGSLFWFEVPLRVAPAASRADPDRAEIHRAAALRILVVDDSPLNRELVRDMLRHQGHDVLCAADGAEAVARAADTPLDVVLMDLRMPGMDGIEATRRIRALGPPAGAVRILGLTANVLVAEQRVCRDAGMDGMLTKPIAWPELLTALSTARSRSGPVRSKCGTPARDKALG
jgi:signal transduction histidine kinase/ActR/RegA family two-component response regulator